MMNLTELFFWIPLAFMVSIEGWLIVCLIRCLMQARRESRKATLKKLRDLRASIPEPENIPDDEPDTGPCGAD